MPRCHRPSDGADGLEKRNTDPANPDHPVGRNGEFYFGTSVEISIGIDKRELRRRSAIEPMIGHAKNDGRLGRNYLLGHDGDRINALLAAAGHNLRLILRKLRLLFVLILPKLLRTVAKQDTWPKFPSIQKSIA